MKDTEKLQIYVTYANGSMQSWGYDGDSFDTYDAMFDNLSKDFHDGFFDTYKEVKGMFLVWGVGLPIADQLKDVPTTEISPICGSDLVDTVADWLNSIGVPVYGN